jgi:hypothetical protein
MIEPQAPQQSTGEMLQEARATPPRKKRRRHGFHGMIPDGVPDMTGARAFVTAIFVLLGASFVAWTGYFIYEFRDQDWLALLLLHSHLFLFYPTLGLVALVAFHLPATVFTHMYWTHISHGRIRYCIGAFVVVALSWGFSSHLLTTGAREVWEIAPKVLAVDRPDPTTCADGRQSCRRVALLDGITSMRTAAQQRFSMSKFARVCRPDPLLEVAEDFNRERFCFAANGKLSGETCCLAQARYATHLDELWATSANRSHTDFFDQFALPLKTFFVLVVITIGVLLVIWRRLLETEYKLIAPAIERALLIGAVAMLPWPFMDYAYASAMQTLSGRWTFAPQLRLSLVIAPWALLLLVFFLGRMSRKIERMGQLAGAVVSMVALLRYEELNDAAVRTLGVGAPAWIVVVLPLLSIACLTALRWPAHLQKGMNGMFGRQPDVPPPS